MNISGKIADEIYNGIKYHPTRHGRTIIKFMEDILKDYLESPKAKFAESQRDLLAEKLRGAKLENQLRVLEESSRLVEVPGEEEKSQGRVSPPQLHIEPVASPATETGTPAEPAGNFHAVIESTAALEAPSKSYICLRIKVTEGPYQGCTFVDRIVDFPPGERAKHLKRAVDLQPDDSIQENVDLIVGKVVLIRRSDKTMSDGTVRKLTFYYPPLPGRPLAPASHENAENVSDLRCMHF